VREIESACAPKARAKLIDKIENGSTFAAAKNRLIPTTVGAT
jgi:hypothetical protein